MTQYYFVEPLDILMIHGNKSFGQAGQHGEVVMPPWPSLFAGAFRSALLGEDGDKLAQFVAVASDRKLKEQDKQARIRPLLGEALFASLGTPDSPGAFRLTWLSLATSRSGDGGIDPAIPLPADLAAFDDPDVAPLVSLHPASLPTGSSASAELPLTPLLPIAKQIKPEPGRWLNGLGLSQHLAAQSPGSTITTGELYKRETRLGIALNANSRTAENGALYTTEAVSFCPGAGFLVGLEGCQGLLPENGLLRLGGDGKAARYSRVDSFTPPTPPAIKPEGTFRLILASPGIFSGGWLPERVTNQSDGSYRLNGDGFSARLVSAAVGRHDVVSGWDLVHWQPKTAQRVAPAGSVYWFDRFQGDPGKLAAWVAGGLWGENPDLQRRAEGYNLAWLAAWN